MGILSRILEKCYLKLPTPVQSNYERYKMNMNNDDPTDHRDLNMSIDNYNICEVVAVPQNFDIKSFLSMREQMGMFKAKNIDSKLLEAVSMAVTCSPIFSSMNNALINPYVFSYFLHILDELGLIIKNYHNPIRKNYRDKPYLEFCQRWEEGRYTYIRGQEVKRISFIVINIVQLFSQDVIDEAKKALEDIEKFQTDANKKMEEMCSNT
jgi:hypothetical protein